jgi:ATP-dependent DNA helicase RecG
MTREELDFILKKGETYLIEFKERVNASLAREMTAFANASGGMVLIGVSDGGSVTGVRLTNRLRSQIQDIAQNCQPSLAIELEEHNDIILLKVPEAEIKPVQCADGFFLRQGANSQKLNRDQIVSFVSREGLVRWDEQIYGRYTFGEIFSPPLLKTFLQKAGIQTSLSDKDILTNLEVLKKKDATEYLTNAGFLFFGKLPELARSHMEMTCALYKGIKKTYILDRKDFDDDIITNIDNAILFVQRNTNDRYSSAKRNL